MNNKKIKINKKNRKGGLSTIIISLVLVLIVLVSIPIFKGLSNSNVNQANKANAQYVEFANVSTEMIAETVPSGDDDIDPAYN